jgi:3-dehydro-glucose-6-phosphate--glutamate transaminase
MAVGLKNLSSTMIRRTEIKAIPFDTNELLEIVTNNQFARGEYLDKLAVELASLFQKKFCVLCSSGSAALLLAMRSFADAPRVLVPAASTCYSIPNSVIAAGGTPVFCDLDPETGNLCVSDAERIFEEAPYDLVISPNHFGILSGMDMFERLGVPVIEDSAQSAMTNAVCGIRGNVGVLSFYPTKYLNGMDGGAILTDDEHIFQAASDAVYYDHQEGYDGRTRFNFRLTNLNAYLAHCSLLTLKDTSRFLADLSRRYMRQCDELGIEYLRSSCEIIPHRFVLKLRSKTERDAMIELLRVNLIEAAVELMMVSETTTEPNALNLVETTMSIPFHKEIRDTDIDQIFNILEDGIRNN